MSITGYACRPRFATLVSLRRICDFRLTVPSQHKHVAPRRSVMVTPAAGYWPFVPLKLMTVTGPQKLWATDGLGRSAMATTPRNRVACNEVSQRKDDKPMRPSSQVPLSGQGRKRRWCAPTAHNLPNGSEGSKIDLAQAQVDCNEAVNSRLNRPEGKNPSRG